MDLVGTRTAAKMAAEEAEEEGISEIGSGEER